LEAQTFLKTTLLRLQSFKDDQSKMPNTKEKLLAIGSELWLFQAIDTYLYELCSMFEEPSTLLPAGLRPFRSLEEDWSAHFSNLAERLHDAPLRLLVIYHALRRFLESNQQEAKEALVREMLIDLERHSLASARERLLEFVSTDETVPERNAALKLFLHLSEEPELNTQTSITDLDLSGDLYSAALAERLSRFNHLRILRLSRCGLIDKDLGFLQAMPELEHLDLSQNAVSSVGLRSLKEPASLQSLNMSGTNLNSTGMMLLRQMTRLETLYLPQGFDDESIDSLQGSLPQCKIQRAP
jgi:hypothetical protein